MHGAMRKIQHFFTFSFLWKEGFFFRTVTIATLFQMIFWTVLVTILFTLILQYGFTLYPCTLCIYERLIYGISLLIALLGFFSTTYPYKRFFWGLLLLSFLSNSGVSIYHVLVEQKIVSAPPACKMGMLFPFFQSAESIRAHLLSPTQFVPCDADPPRFFGLSLATYNVILSCGWFLYTVFWGWHALKKEDR